MLGIGDVGFNEIFYNYKNVKVTIIFCADTFLEPVILGSPKILNVKMIKVPKITSLLCDPVSYLFFFVGQF